jgi:mRNA interferase MazF
MRRGEIWFAATPGGDRPVLVLTRDPVAGRIGSVVVAALTRTVFRRRIVTLSPARMAEACRALRDAVGC